MARPITSRALPAEEKSRAVAAVLVQRRSVEDVAQEFGVTKKTIYDWINVKKEQESRRADSNSAQLDRLGSEKLKHLRAIRDLTTVIRGLAE